MNTRENKIVEEGESAYLLIDTKKIKENLYIDISKVFLVLYVVLFDMS